MEGFKVRFLAVPLVAFALLAAACQPAPPEQPVAPPKQPAPAAPKEPAAPAPPKPAPQVEKPVAKPPEPKPEAKPEVQAQRGGTLTFATSRDPASPHPFQRIQSVSLYVKETMWESLILNQNQ